MKQPNFDAEYRQRGTSLWLLVLGTMALYDALEVTSRLLTSAGNAVNYTSIPESELLFRVSLWLALAGIEVRQLVGGIMNAEEFDLIVASFLLLVMGCIAGFFIRFWRKQGEVVA